MSEKIVSKVPDYKGEKVGTWPPLEPSGVKGFFWVKEVGEDLEISADPPELCHNVFGKAPGVITDQIDPYYHPMAQCWVESRSKLQQLDAATGSFTTDSREKPALTDEQRRAKIEKELKEDRDRAWREAVERYDSKNLNLSEEQKAICKKKNNIIAHQTGKESFKHNGKEYKLRTPE